MPRFFVDLPLFANSTIALPATVVRHLQVLRLNAGDSLTLFNGQGGEFEGTLTHLDKKTASISIHEHLEREVELPFAVTLVQGIAGGDKMDWLIEKAVELGVTSIQPIQTERSVVRLQGERAEKRVLHWQAIAQAACEQCGRNQIPNISKITNLNTWLSTHHPQESPCMLLSPRANQTLSQWFSTQKPQAQAQALQQLTLLIGPEGGLSNDEEQAALNAGLTPLSLGKRVLRTETAGLAVLAALNTLCGEF